MTQGEFNSAAAAVGWSAPAQVGYEVIGGDDLIGLTGNWSDWLAKELAAEEHRQGLEVGLSYEHCGFCRDEYLRLHCPHSSTYVLQTLADPRPNTYCSTCGKHLETGW